MDAFSIGWVDTAMLALVVVSMAIGAARGFTFELLSIVGWVAAWFAGSWLGPYLAPWLHFGEAGSSLNRGIAFASAFVLVLLIWSLGARTISGLVGKTPLRPLDRLLGAGFGIARALLVLLALATVLAFTPAGRSDAWQASQGAVWLNAVLLTLLPRVLEAPAAEPAQSV